MNIKHKNFLFVALTIVVYVALVIVVNIIHNVLFNVNVVFYSALFDSMIVVSIFALFIGKYKKLLSLSTLEFILLLIILWLAGYAYAISLPTVIDRSLSIYLLEKIYSQNGQLRVDKIEDIIKNDYVREHRLAEIRLTEQIESGTIEIVNGCVRLTDKGVLVAKISTFAQKNLLPKKRLLMNEYTNVLTDPIDKNTYHTDRDCPR